jgi:hypothetical protein
MPDQEFDLLGEDELALLSRRFERPHVNWVNMQSNTRTCFQCSKLGHFVGDCPEKVDNKDGYKHKSRTDGKYRSRCDHKSEHWGEHKDERWSWKKESRGKAQAMLERATSTPVLRTPPRARVAIEDHVWFEDWWMVASWCDE